jgi:hypothetical protein
MTHTLEATRRIQIANISTSERFYKPSPKQIDEMAASLKAIGQLTAIMVHPVTRTSWRIVAGGTRLLAAFKLGWTHIRADIISGSADDYRIIELTENAERRNLTAAQRKQARAELRKLIREKLAGAKAAKGGRGKKGGLSEAAREMGVARSTAQDASKKPAGNTENRHVSAPRPNGGGHAEPSTSHAAEAPAKPSVALESMLTKISWSVTVSHRARIERYNKERCGNGPLSDCCHKLTSNALDAEGF